MKANKKQDKTWVIYKHTLIADCPKYGWSYIGQTSKKKPEERWCGNGMNYTRKTSNGTYTYFANEIMAHGWESFKTEILESGITTQKVADDREQYWIAFYHTYVKDPECRGFNLTPGGYGGGSRPGKIHINNGVVERSIFKDDPIPDGFVVGGLKRNNGAAVSAAKKGKPSKSRGKRWFNNGTEQTMAEQCPEGWIPGRLPCWRSDKELYNNGIEQKFFVASEAVPPGWIKGAIPGSVVRNTLGRIAYNDGSRHIYLKKGEIPPEGFVKGYAAERAANFSHAPAQIGKRWYNNGVDQKYFLPTDIIPEGWTLGCCKLRNYSKK